MLWQLIFISIHKTRKGTAGVPGSKSFMNREHCWELQECEEASFIDREHCWEEGFVEPAFGTSVLVRAETNKATQAKISLSISKS